MKRFASLSVLALAALAATPFAGCKHEATVDSVSIPGQGAYSWVSTDPQLNAVATVTRVSKARVSDLLKVQVDIRNNTNTPQTVMYRLIWLDDLGQTVDTPLSTWQRLYIQGRQTGNLVGVAPETRVTDARLEMILGDQTNR